MKEEPKSKTVSEIRTIVAVPETDILEDNYSDDDDQMLGAEEIHERDESINCKYEI